MSESVEPRCTDCGVYLGPAHGHFAPRCPTCGYVQRRYPTVGVAVVVRDSEGRVLLGRRKHGAFAGLWCIPCGRLEWDEDVRGGAEREFLEETGLEVRAGAVVAVHSNFHVPERQTVGIWFEGHVHGGTFGGGDDELSELEYFDPSAPPDLAFPTDALVLQQLAAEAGQKT